MKHAVLLTIFTTLTVFALGGCVHRPSPNTNGDENTIAKATSEIDQGQYQTAIDQLNTFLAQNPQDARVRILLSNAYVRWSGIQFTDFEPLARFYLDQSEKPAAFSGSTRSLLKALRKSQGAVLNTTANALEDFEKVLAVLEAFSEAFDLIPELTEDNYEHFADGLREAVNAQSPKKGDVLYLAVLQVVDLKFKWLHGDVFKFMDHQCAVIPKSLVEFFKNTRQDYQKISNELIYVYPSLGNELSGDLDKFDELITDVQQKMDSAFGSSADVPSAQERRSVWECL